MLPISMLINALAFNLLKTTVQICASAKDPSISGEDYSFYAIIQIKETKDMLQLLRHGLSECIEFARSIQCHNLYRRYRVAVRWMIRNLDLLGIEIRVRCGNIKKWESWCHGEDQGGCLLRVFSNGENQRPAEIFRGIFAVAISRLFRL